MHEQLISDWIGRNVPRARLDEGGRLWHGGDPAGEYAALTEAVALLPVITHAQLLAEGPDAIDYLHRRLTQSIRTLEVGRGAHALLLGGDGRMQADMCLWLGADSAMLVTPRSQAESAFELLDRYILMDQLELTRFWLNEPMVMLAGPRAPALIGGLMDPRPRAESLADGWSGWLSVNVAGLPCRVLGDERFRVPVYHVSMPPMAAGQLLNALAGAVREAGGAVAGEAAFERLRIKSGVTQFGRDTDERTIPLEARMLNAISFDKGCYPGQEVLARIRNLGHPARVLVRLTIDGEHDIAGAGVRIGAEEAGPVTSSITWSGMGTTFALAMLPWMHRRAQAATVTVGDRTLEGRVEMMVDEGLFPTREKT